MAYELVQSSQAHNTLRFEYSNDDRTYTPFNNATNNIINVVRETRGVHRRANYTLRAPSGFRFLRINWTPCAQSTNCRDYASPSLGHLCAYNRGREQPNAATCFPRGLNPPVVDPSPEYCFTRMVDNFWRVENFVNRVNLMGSPTDAINALHFRHDIPHEGIGGGRLQLLPRPPARAGDRSPTSWYTMFGERNVTNESEHCMNSFVTLPTIAIEITASAGTRFNIVTRGLAPPNMTNTTIPSESQHNYTSTTTHTFILSISQYNCMRMLALTDFVNPSNQPIFIDNIYFPNNFPRRLPLPREPEYIDRFEGPISNTGGRNLLNQPTGIRNGMAIYRIQNGRLQLRPSSAMSTWFSNLESSRTPATSEINFEVSATRRATNFEIVVRYNNTELVQPLIRYVYISADNVNMTHHVSVNLNLLNAPVYLTRPETLIQSISIRNISPLGTDIFIDNLRFGSSFCRYSDEPDANRRDYRPRPAYTGFSRAYLGNQANVRRSVIDHDEL
ncbi:hypothetical protein BKA69DRAFT_831790 [Paraphysoderma sedebokerense]|nr:hypothetical protein BKA69DRAFT_831790 [Paraphysoderma sedebokerense]